MPSIPKTVFKGLLETVSCISCENAAIVLINCMKMMTIDLFTYSMLNLISKGFPIISSIISGFVALLKLPV